MLRFLSCGESHGPMLIGILDGMPAGLKLDINEINEEMARRQQGYGRGNRQKIEKDTVEFVGGVRHGTTTGAPVGIVVHNRDFENWQYVMSPAPIDLSRPEAREQFAKKAIERFRPGHADLAGTLKFRHQDIRDVLERASARETAMRVAAGAVCNELLKHFGIAVASHVIQVGGIRGEVSVQDLSIREIQGRAASSELSCLDSDATERMKELIKQAWQDGDSLGGIVEVLADGLPVGLGSYTQWDRRLDGMLAQAIMSVQAIKAVEIGEGFQNATLPGSQVHDAIYASEQNRVPFYRRTNQAGGIEGGMTNGERLYLRAYMKPIPTMRRGLESVSFPDFETDRAHYERSDVCAISAASVVCKAMVCLVLASAMTDKFAGDSMTDMDLAIKEYEQYCRSPQGIKQGTNQPFETIEDREPEGNEDAVGEF